MTPAALHWSSGKDSAFTLHRVIAQKQFDVRTLVCTVNEVHERVAIHGVRRSILRAQAAALGLPLVEVALPFPCANDIYEARIGAALERLHGDGIVDHVFGDLFLEDVRAYRENLLGPLELRGHFPLWGEDTGKLAGEMIASGLRAYVAALDPKRVPRELCGAAFDADFLATLPEDVDPCGERGEFHTLVCDMPDFANPLDMETGETVERDGFVYTDFLLRDAPPPPAA